MQILTSESVTPGHPDKVCDQISDAILDAHLSFDPHARVAAEVLASASGIVIAGEVKSAARHVNPAEIARRVIREIGYDRTNGIDPATIDIQNHMVEQSREISGAVDGRGPLGAGDQGMMFGYATDETDEMMPTPLAAARAITDRLVEARESGEFPWLGPDGKAQVTLRYDGQGNPSPEIESVVVSTQHTTETRLDLVRYVLREEIVRKAAERVGLHVNERTALHLNPAGAWTLGGPASDAGLTGRKIIVDTYGGASRHGGGAFSGKDPSKVDRSAAYAARHAAKCLVDRGLARRAEVQLSYAIGVVEPVSLSVETFGTSEHGGDVLSRLLLDEFDFTPQGIIDRFDLARPIYQQTAARGHFGHGYFPWEKVQVPAVSA